MKLEKVGKPRFSTRLVSGGLRIDIPAKRRIFVLLFVSIWLVFWTIGGFAAVFAFSEVDGLERAFLSFWLIAWALGWCAVLWSVLWQLFGSEIVIVTTATLTLKRRLFLNLFARNYSVASIKSMELAEIPEASPARQLSLEGFNKGTISFDYGTKTVTFGMGLDKAEARQILDILKKRIPSAFKS